MKIRNIIILFIMMIVVLTIVSSAVTVKGQTDNEYDQALTLSDEELAQLLAPIALYPDVLLLQMLIASTYPFEVAEAERWLARNPHLVNEKLEKALEDKDWDLSVIALCHYPDILNMMVENLKWTAKLGDAFVYQQQDVMDTVQDLRLIARDQGNLTTTDKQKVIVEKRIIRIEPAHYNYVYIPVYDPLLVYGPWRYPAFRPYPVFYSGVAITGPGIFYSTRLSLGFGYAGWSVFDWPSRNVIVIHVDRTRRFNRNYTVHSQPRQSRYWSPDYAKRAANRPPAGQRPVYRNTVNPPPRRAVITPRNNTDQTRRETRDIRTRQTQERQPAVVSPSRPVQPRPESLAKRPSEAGPQREVRTQRKPGERDSRPEVIERDRQASRERRPEANVNTRETAPDTARTSRQRNTDTPPPSRTGERREDTRARERGIGNERIGRR